MFLLALLLSAAPPLLLDGCGRPDPAALALRQLKQSHQSLTADDFLKAAGRGDLDSVRLFLQAGVDRNVQDSRGRTALMAAAEAGRTPVVRLLLEESAKPDLADSLGETALLLAAGANQAECVRQLVEANADPLRRDQKNWSPLLKAAINGHAATVQVLLATSRDQLARDGQLDRALLVAAYLGNDELIRALLDRGANVNAALEKGQTALMCAATSGKADTVSLLLDRGANPRAVNAEGSTAALLATQRGFTDVGKMIDAATAGQPVPPPDRVADLQAPAPEDDRRAQEEAAEAARAHALEQTLLKQKGVDPQSVLARDTGQDADGDGFTDDEEIAAGTDPHDPASHPPYAVKARMKALTGEPFPVTFDGADDRGRRARVSVRGAEGGAARHAELGVGERVPELPYRVSRIRPRTTRAKDTDEPVDASELTLAHVESGEKIVLVKSLPATGPDTGARLSLELAGGRHYEVTVKVGQEFSFPNDEKTHYRVIDIRPRQTVLRVRETGQTITVPREAGDGADPAAGAGAGADAATGGGGEDHAAAAHP